MSLSGLIRVYGCLLFTIAVTAQIAVQPTIKTGGVVSASAFGQFTSAAPGSWIEIYGANLAASTRSWTTADFTGTSAPTSLDGTRVQIGGLAAYIDFVSPNQVNVQIPTGVGPGPQPLTVSSQGQTSAPYTLIVNAVQPGLLAVPSFNIAGKQYVTALFADGSTYVLPPVTVSGIRSRRARVGETIILYGIGFGPVTPSIAAGQVVTESNSLASSLHISFGQTEAQILYAGLVSNAVGLYQVNVVVPSIAGGDSVPLAFTLAGVPGQQTLYTAVQSTTPGPAIDLTGTWSGNASDSSGPATMKWVLTQIGTDVLGTMTASTPSGAIVFNGAFGGTVLGLSFTFNIDIPRGGIPALPLCSATVTGSSSSVTTTLIQGIYAGSNSCTGSFSNGTFTLVKQ